MKKNYFTFLFAIFSIVMYSQTVNTVRDTLGVAFYAEYTTVANTSGVTFTLSLTENAGVLADIAEVEIYRSYGDNRVNGRTRIAKGITDGSSGSVVFVDDSQVWTDDTNSPTGYTGDGAFDVGRPTSYSVKVITSDGTGFSSSRAIPSVYIDDELNPDSAIADPINDDMTLLTRVYENYPTEETALLVIGLVPSTNYPSDPYQLFVDAIQARTGDGTVNWGSFPCFISEVLYNEVSALDGRGRDIPESRIFWSNKGVTYHLVEKDNINAEDIDANGMTNVSFKIGRPNATQPDNGITSYNSLVSVPIQITGVLSVDDATKVSTIVRAVDNRVIVSNVQLETEIKIYNITGSLVKTINTNEDLEFNFNTGLWLATITTAEGQKSVKLLVM
ncbi:T9SS type A sorting domain-containing protein [Winogradskyella echinorum]|uniref:T9SS type A sorting domain-containing protein n=1 Tax=Winogradskyella echinorum TaxID=538189 RepID=A0ABR6Y1D0_9FLAO|nr:T9SS type A sorting domain-containing protein [Winogradskyella echinorum]MBC3846542.1 T9SS type A sorting domain-containing protein [Winogradskyella echinorum]MBC5750890.1 T9SS type A sorting domain-containing protein [Winogradskyella echinorum]